MLSYTSLSYLLNNLFLKNRKIKKNEIIILLYFQDFKNINHYSSINCCDNLFKI